MKVKISPSTLTTNEILSIINKSGYVMEQRVAGVLENAKWRVSQSYKFQDQGTGVSREVDILSDKSLSIALSNEVNLVATVELIIECKGDDSPLIVFPRTSKSSLSPDMFAFIGNPYPAVMKLVKTNPNSGCVEKEGNNRYNVISNLASKMDKSFLDNNTSILGCQACSIYGKKDAEKDSKNEDKFDANNTTYYGAIEELIKALTYRRVETNQRKEENIIAITLIHPILIWREKIYIYDSANKNLQETKYTSIYHSHRAGNVNGDFIIYVVQENSLNDFISEMERHLSELMKSSQSYMKTINVLK